MTGFLGKIDGRSHEQVLHRNLVKFGFYLLWLLFSKISVHE